MPPCPPPPPAETLLTNNLNVTFIVNSLLIVFMPNSGEQGSQPAHIALHMTVQEDCTKHQNYIIYLNFVTTKGSVHVCKFALQPAIFN